MQGDQHAIELFAENQGKSEEELDELELLREKIEGIMKLYTQHSLVSILCAVKTNSLAYQPPVLNTIIVSNKSPAIIGKIKCFMIEDVIEHEQETGETFEVQVFLKIHKLLSVILATISKSFYMYINDPMICLLNFDDFKQMLKHKRFQVTCEDEVVRALSLWVMDSTRTQE